MLYSKKYFHLFLVLAALFYSIDFSARAQSNQDEKSLLVDSLFRSKQYSEALPYLNNILKNYPKDPIYHYQLGVSYLYATNDIDKAIEHLLFASTGDVPNLVYYHLGYAYHASYQFDEAISYYRRFTVNGEDPSVSAHQIEQLVSQCENGNFMLRYIHQPNVIDNKLVAIDEFANYAVTKPAAGSFIQTPKDLRTKYDVDENHTSYIFYPNNPKPGDKIVYSSYGATTLYGKDLFLIEMLEDGFWSKPQNLGDEINSRLDEDFPYLSPDGLTLYFASKGHYSMGGYDIYRSVYNPSAGQWSTPENLGFPISSPYDDFFYVPDRDEQMAFFGTQRSNLADSANVVLVEIDKNPIRRTISSIETIQEIAQLNPNGEGFLPSVTEDVPDMDNKPQKPNTASFSVVENDPEYTRALANGFAQQMLADSLRKKLENLRARFDNISTAEARRNLENQVVDVEDKLLEAQRNADVYFAKASQIEQDYLTGKRRPIDKPNSTFAIDHPDYLYQAQYAPTVFQIEELSQLAKLERNQPQLQQQREKIKSTQIKLADFEEENLVDSKEYQALYAEYITLLQKFNNLMGSYIGGKKKLYNDCISVALIKAGANSNLKIKNEIDRANTHFRSAMAIRNNATPESVDESEYEALLLDELAVIRLEIAFAKLWEMQLFEQQLLSNVYRLEQSIFGHTLPNSNQADKATLEKDSHIIQQSDQKVLLQKIDDQPVTTQEFAFEPDKDPPFQILEKTPYSNDNPIPQHNPLPDGLIYKIQLAAFSKQVSYNTFKGMTPITAEPLSNGKVTKYYAGLFTKQDEAETALPQVRSLGFKDAFIVAWHDGRSVTLTRASGLEASTPTISNTSTPDTTRIAIEEDGKLYVIQLGGYVGRLPADMLQTIRALAPGKDIVRKPDNQGGFLYSIGSYTDPNEATRIKDNLVASGIKSAIVVAVDVDN